MLTVSYRRLPVSHFLPCQKKVSSKKEKLLNFSKKKKKEKRKKKRQRKKERKAKLRIP